MSRLLLLCLSFVLGAGVSPLHAEEPDPLILFVSLNDTLPPTIECPPSDTVDLDMPGVCGVAYNYTVTFSDDQPNPILIQLSGLASGSEYPLGTIANVFLVTDQVGNTAMCSFSVTVLPLVETLACADNTTITLGQNCTAQVSAAQVFESGFLAGCIDQYSVTIDKTPPFGNGPWVPADLVVGDLGKTYGVRVRDEYSGNSCWGQITVADSLPPVLTCENFTIPCAVLNITPGYLKDSLGVVAAMPQVLDACGGPVSVNFTDTHFNQDCATGFFETINRDWVAQDQHGNSASCVQQIKLKNVLLSEVKIPADLTQDCNDFDLSLDKTGRPYIEFGGRKFSNICSINYDFIDSFVQTCPSSKYFYRTWVLEYWCDDTEWDTIQRIDILDKTGPAIICDSAATAIVTASGCIGKAVLPYVKPTDDCSAVISIRAIWEADGLLDTLTGSIGGPDTLGVFDTIPNFPIGTTIVRYEAVDECDNVGSCELAMTLYDSVAPTAVCFPLIIAQLSAEGNFALGADTLDAGSSDACGQQLFYKVRRATSNPICLSSDQLEDQVVFCCADMGDTLEVILRVYDIAVPEGPVAPDFALDQSDDCTMKVVVLDTLPISCSAPPDAEMVCADFDPSLASYGLPIYSCTVDSAVVTVDYSQFDTACTFGTIVRTYQVFAENGTNATCVQEIQVNYVQDYYIKFPNDVIVTMCDSTGIYGVPTFLQNGCEDLEVTFTDQLFNIVPDACLKIERLWKIYNRCTYDSTSALIQVTNPNPNATANHPDNLVGPVVSAPGTTGAFAPSSIAIAPGLTPTDYSTFWNLDANGYQYKQIIKIIDTQEPVIDNCPADTVLVNDTTANNPMLWSELYWWDNVIDSHDLPDAPSSLSITASDACVGGSELQASFLLFLDLDNDGIRETVINSADLPSPGTVNFNNATNPNYSGGTSRVFDERPVQVDDLYRWAVHQSANGNILTASVQWKTAAQVPNQNNSTGQPGIEPQLPYGNHQIEWTIKDGCGNESVCKYDFTVQDGKAPTVTCVADLSVPVPASGSITIQTIDLVQNADDNYTPPNLLKYSARKSGAGSGFPVDGDGDPVSSLTFDCDETGTQTGELWVQDLAGNPAFCVFNINILPGNCGDPGPTIAGALKTELDTPVVNATVMLQVTFGGGQVVDSQAQTDPSGAFEFLNGAPFGSNYTLTPSKDDDDFNGVSTLDLLLISRHILGLQPLNSPYKMIAADANHNNSITSFDIVEIRKLILGIYDKFPANTSWRFVDKDFVFANPNNPFQLPFPETIARNNISADELADDFVGVKIGDVNNTAKPDSLTNDDETDRDGNALFFKVQDRTVQRGEVFTVYFNTDEKVEGYQFTLETEDLEVVEIIPGAGMSQANFAVFENAVTTSVENSAGEFSIVFRANKPGQLSEMLGVSNRITRAEAYKVEGGEMETFGVGLLFDNKQGSKPGFELYQNQPNPFKTSTIIGFQLPAAGDATLTVFDATGRVLYSKPGQYDRGRHIVSIEQHLLGEAGVLYYKLETATNSAVKKMVFLR